jgi:hypothetical protein
VTVKKEGLPVELELQAERANALAISSDRLQAALAEFARAEAALAAAAPGDRARLLEERMLRRAEAAERLWFVMVQREAIGLAQHEAVTRIYQVPAEVRQHAGPRPARYRSPEASPERSG